ncbi:MAG TPA: 2-amino-4-hydroxy-6-hydroxymethyldihydropteridine diphosphokinase [Dehalococcoidia bacterium]|nr:2-amino-4-hydroxy-6-hydroxymethyldihydropteridine diphosphokinase [Dehalococcoidia bacterium]
MAIYIALGANLGDRRANLREALRLLPPDVEVEEVSALYESPPQPPAPPPAYLNAACRIATRLEPRDLLHYLKRIERDLGRRNAKRWAPRPIDLDIALYHDRVVEEDDLVIPHPRLSERAFVLQPLLDLDARLVHPVTGERLSDLLSSVKEGELVRVAKSDWAF